MSRPHREPPMCPWLHGPVLKGAKDEVSTLTCLGAAAALGLPDGSKVLPCVMSQEREEREAVVMAPWAEGPDQPKVGEGDKVGEVDGGGSWGL